MNLSKSKMLYSFPKADRFFYQKKPLCDSIYNIPDKFSKRKAALGYGTKSDFTKNVAGNPSPNQYNISAYIDVNLKKKKGYTFGESRHKMNQTGIVKKYLENQPG